MRCERDGATTQKIVQETPVIIDGRRGKYVTEIDFTILDPSSPQNMPSMVEFTQEMPIEEAKRRLAEVEATSMPKIPLNKNN